MTTRPVMKLSTKLEKALAEQMAQGGYGSHEALMLDALQALADRRQAIQGIKSGLKDMHADRMRSWQHVRRTLIKKHPALAAYET